MSTPSHCDLSSSGPMLINAADTYMDGRHDDKNDDDDDDDDKDKCDDNDFDGKGGVVIDVHRVMILVVGAGR